jgi:uncharacterized cupin superfamily protein
MALPLDTLGPPPHLHHACDERFYVLEGTLTPRAGEWSASLPQCHNLARQVHRSRRGDQRAAGGHARWRGPGCGTGGR